MLRYANLFVKRQKEKVKREKFSADDCFFRLPNLEDSEDKFGSQNGFSSR